MVSKTESKLEKLPNGVRHILADAIDSAKTSEALLAIMPDLSEAKEAYSPDRYDWLPVYRHFNTRKQLLARSN